MKTLILISIILLTAACSKFNYIEKVKVDTIKVASPTIEENLKAKIITDTVIVTNKIIDKDTVLDVRYYPVKKNFYIKAKPDTVKIVDVDTLQTTQIVEKINENKIEKIIILFLVASLIIMTLKFRR